MMFKDADTTAVEFPKAAVAAMNVELAQIAALLAQDDLTAIDGFSQIPQALQRMLSICSVYGGLGYAAGIQSQFPPRWTLMVIWSANSLWNLKTNN